MNAKLDRDMNEDEYSFIQEKVIPRTKNTKKKLFKYTCITVVMAVLFGIISSLVFNASNHVLNRQNKSEKKEPISLTDEEEEKEEPLVTEEEELEQEKESTEAANEKDGLTDQDIFRAFNMNSYQKIYSLMRNMSEQIKFSMVTVMGVTNITNWFEMENSISNYGIILRIDEDYIYILCNYNNVEDASKIKVGFYNDEVARAELMDYDKETGLTILKVNTESLTQRTKAKITEADIGESYQLSYGTPVLGLGSPDGTMYSMAIGYVTADSINKYIVDGKFDYYHTNVMENAYGEGFFVNMEGKIIGIITHQYKEESDSNMMSFLGITKLMPIILGMLNQQEKAYLGVKVCELPSEDGDKLNVNYGIYITDVMADSPAFKKGLKTGDVITAINGSSVSSVTALMNKVYDSEPGDELTFTIIRQTKVEYPKRSFQEKKITVKLGQEK